MQVVRSFPRPNYASSMTLSDTPPHTSGRSFETALREMIRGFCERPAEITTVVTPKSPYYCDNPLSTTRQILPNNVALWIAQPCVFRLCGRAEDQHVLLTLRPPLLSKDAIANCRPISAWKRLALVGHSYPSHCALQGNCRSHNAQRASSCLGRLAMCFPGLDGAPLIPRASLGPSTN